MYAILSGGELVALCDKPRYVKQNDNGIYVEAAAAEAIAISVNGDLYNINGGDAIPDAPEAVAVLHDAAEFVFRNHVRIEKNEAATGAAIVGVEGALCELDTAAEERLSAIEDALCELDGANNGGSEN